MTAIDLVAKLATLSEYYQPRTVAEWTQVSASQSGPGQVFIVPRGVEHRPVAHDEVRVLLIEPRGTPNTGEVASAQPRRVT